MLAIEKGGAMLLKGYRSLSLLDPTLLSPADPGGALPADDSDIDNIEGLGDAGKKALKAERQARRDAAKAASDAADTLKSLQDQVKVLTDAQDKANKDALAKAEKDREEAGEFKTLAETRATERDKAVADLQALQTSFDALKTASLGMYKSDFDTLPAEVKDLFTGAEDDPVALMAFLPKAKAAAAKISENAKSQENPDDKGNPPNPQPTNNSSIQVTDEQARESFRRSYS